YDLTAIISYLVSDHLDSTNGVTWPKKCQYYSCYLEQALSMSTAAKCDKNATSTWVFGYGSLIHTPNFLYDQRVVGHIRGYRRVFWQGSTDHRGTPERPGRTVTLTAENHPAAVTWGVAFQLAGTPQEQAATLSYLEWREKQYDVRQLVDVYGAHGEILVRGALVYIASPANQNYLGPADTQIIAAQIATSRGPSGPNWEYLFKLADAMRSIGVPDGELYALEDMVREEILRQQELRSMTGLPAAAAEGSPSMVASDPLAGVAMKLSLGSATGVAGDDDEHTCEDRDGFRMWHTMGPAQLPVAPEQADMRNAVVLGGTSHEGGIVTIQVGNKDGLSEERLKDTVVQCEGDQLPVSNAQIVSLLCHTADDAVGLKKVTTAFQCENFPPVSY
ncbi:hypothetical protein Vafri_8919, partial [Volvox africanus]